jgi:putative flippase GtrA
MIKTIFQLLRYISVGATSTLADYGSYIFFTRIAAMPALEANPLSYLIGNVVSFFGHRPITFRSQGNPMPEYVRFVFVSIAGLLVSQIVIAFALYIGIADLVAKAAAVLVSGAFNYLMNRFWTFRMR